MKRKLFSLTVLLLAVSIISPEVHAQKKLNQSNIDASDEDQEEDAVTDTAPKKEDAADLAKKLANPISNLISVPLQNNTDFGIGTMKGSRNTLNVQPVVPFHLGSKINLITRYIFPIISQYNITGYGQSQVGLSDAVLTGFISPSQSKNGITWGAGPVLLIPTGTNDFLTGKKFGIGPSLVFLKQHKGLTVGALINQLWSVAGSETRSDISQMYVNPFVAYNWKSGAGINCALEWTQNWKAKTSNVMVTPTISGLTSLGKQKVSLAVGPRINFASEEVRSALGFRAQLVFLFPG